MADNVKFFEENNKEEVETPEVSTIKIGEEEYAQEELEKLVGLGKIGKEAEEKYKTSIDKVWPEFTKKSQKVKELEEQIEELSKPHEEPQAQPGEELTNEQIMAQLNSFVNSAVETRLSAHKLVEDCKDLEGKYNGDDGRPRFDSQEVLKFMETEGIKNPERAYKELHAEDIEQWETEKLRQAKPQPMVTETESGQSDKTPEQPRVDNKNFDKILKEVLSGK